MPDFYSMQKKISANQCEDFLYLFFNIFSLTVFRTTSKSLCDSINSYKHLLFWQTCFKVSKCMLIFQVRNVCVVIIFCNHTYLQLNFVDTLPYRRGTRLKTTIPRLCRSCYQASQRLANEAARLSVVHKRGFKP